MPKIGALSIFDDGDDDVDDTWDFPVDENDDDSANGVEPPPASMDWEETSPTRPDGSDQGLSRSDVGLERSSFDIVGTSAMSLSELLGGETDLGDVAPTGETVDMLFEPFDGYRLSGSNDGRVDGRQGAITPGASSPSTFSVKNQRTYSISNSTGVGMLLGLGAFVNGQVSTAAGSDQGSFNTAQLFFGYWGLGIAAPSGLSPSVGYNYDPNGNHNSGFEFAGCRASVLVITPFFSAQYTFDDVPGEIGPFNVSLGFSTALGIFGGKACPISLP